MIRYPAVAGTFYPAEASHLQKAITSLIPPQTEKEVVRGVMVPHAGIVYSGAVAGAVYARIAFPHTFLLLGPNHYGLGSTAALVRSGTWETPLGEVEIDTELAEAILKACPLIQEDASAHREEHSLEVQLPFLQSFQQPFQMVPIIFQPLSWAECTTIARALAQAIQERGSTVVIVASTDMTHYEPHAVAAQRDQEAIDRILALDASGLYRLAAETGLSMCGYVPATIMLLACRQLGATRGQLVRYMTSGEVSGDYNRVVGYAGVLIL
ncbi:MAG: AmmeMemoRadiSam system protein B [Nitrospinota bacterium]|nr:MAG: AmmeMemoRadiSam system protein B [Nitrospinota bacterium]